MCRLTYCFAHGVLKCYVHYDANVRLVYYCDISCRTNFTKFTQEKELHDSNTCFILLNLKLLLF